MYSLLIQMTPQWSLQDLELMMPSLLINTKVILNQTAEVIHQTRGNLTKIEWMAYHQRGKKNNLLKKMSVHRCLSSFNKLKLLLYKSWRIEDCQKFMWRNECLPDVHHFPNGLSHAVVVWIMSFMQTQSAVEVHEFVNCSCLSKNVKPSDDLVN